MLNCFLINEKLTEQEYIFQDAVMCNSFLQNIAKTCCRHKLSPVNRSHGSAVKF